MKKGTNSKKYPLISVVLPSYNAMETLETSLKSLIKTSYPNYEIVVVDDCSKDGTYEYIKDFFTKHPRVRVDIYRNSRNMGASFTRNFAIKKSKGEYIAFAETDMKFDSRWLSELVEYLKNNKDVGAVAGKCCDFLQQNKIGAVGLKFDPATFGVIPIGYGKESNQVNDQQEVGLGSVGTLFRRSVLEKIGAFDEKFRHNIDDIELSLRMWVAGYRQVSVPKSITYHWTFKPLNLRSTPQLKSEIISNKIMRVFLKNYQIKSLIIYLPQLIVYQLMRVAKNLLYGDPKPLIGFMAGIIWNLINLGDTLIQRRRIQGLRKLSDREIFDKIGYKDNYLSFVINIAIKK